MNAEEFFVVTKRAPELDDLERDLNVDEVLIIPLEDDDE